MSERTTATLIEQNFGAAERLNVQVTRVDGEVPRRAPDGSFSLMAGARVLSVAGNVDRGFHAEELTVRFTAHGGGRYELRALRAAHPDRRDIWVPEIHELNSGTKVALTIDRAGR